MLDPIMHVDQLPPDMTLIMKKTNKEISISPVEKMSTAHIKEWYRVIKVARRKKEELSRRGPCALNLLAILNTVFDFLSCEVVIPLYLTRSQLLNGCNLDAWAQLIRSVNARYLAIILIRRDLALTKSAKSR